MIGQVNPNYEQALIEFRKLGKTYLGNWIEHGFDDPRFERYDKEQL
jgi:mannitol/fructose-specific phosphotransferase system IIA component